jgi:hypothetical protein
MNTPYPVSTSSLPGLRVNFGMQHLLRAVAALFRTLAGLNSGLQPSKLADLRFSLFTCDEPAKTHGCQRPTHDGHLPPPC